MLDSRYYVTFTSTSGLTLKVLLGETSPYITGGFGGWEVIDRPKRIGLTRYTGRGPITQDVPVLFDGWSDGQSIESEIDTLVKMSHSPGEGKEPPRIKATGLVVRPELTWVINDLTWDDQNVIWEYIGGSQARVRQACVVHLMQFIDDKVISTPARPTTVSKTVDGAGKTPKELAQEQYGSPDLWTLFIDSNPWMNDPRTPVPKGKKVVVPPRL